MEHRGEETHGFALVFVLGGAEGVEHEGGEDELLDGDEEGGDAVLEVVGGDAVVPREDTLALEDGEDEGLDEVGEDDEFQGGEFEEGAVGGEFGDGFQEFVGFEDGDHADNYGRVSDHEDPEVGEVGLHAGEAVGACGLGGFLRNEDDDVDDEGEEQDAPFGFEEFEGPPGDDVVGFVFAELAAALFAVLDVGEVAFSGRGVRGDPFDKEEEDGGHREDFVQVPDRDHVDGGAVFRDGDDAEEAEDYRGEDDADDLALLFGVGVMREMHEDVQEAGQANEAEAARADVEDEVLEGD